MDGPSGGVGDNRGCGGSGWRGKTYDATNQIKQLLGVPTDDDRPIMNAEKRTPPQNIPRHKHGQIASDHMDQSSSPNNRHQQQRWETNHRYYEGRNRGERFESPGRNYQRHQDMNRTPPHRYDRQHDSYGSPNRNNHRIGSYGDRLYSSSPRGHHMRDRDIRMNGPRNLNSSGGNQGGIGQDADIAECPPTPEVLAELQKQFLYPLRKKSIKFPKAKYFCRLCEYHCDSLVVCRRHIADKRHRRLKEAKDIDTTLRNLPSPSDVQIATIDKLIKKIVDDMRVSPEIMRKRCEVVDQLDKLLKSKVEGCRLEMVGSSLSGFCLKNSDINIDVCMDDNLNPSTALLAVRELVGKNKIYIDILDDLASSFPTMAFTHAQTGLRMVVGACGASAKLTNQLLADYASLDSRVLVLGIAFRYWAQLCQIDNQSRGTLPPHVFPLMVIHFLQQLETPVLPVLHMLHPQADGDVYLRPDEIKDRWKAGANTQNIGRLWLELLRFYSVGFKVSDLIINVRQLQPMKRSEKTWGKKIAVEDPFLQKRNLSRTVSGSAVSEYIMDCVKATYRYYAVPQLNFGSLFNHIAVKEIMRMQSEGSSSECEMEKTDDEVYETAGEDSDDDDTINFSAAEPDISALSIEDTTDDEITNSPKINGVNIQEEQFHVDVSTLTKPVLTVTPSQAAKLILQVQGDQMAYKFDKKVFTNDIDPPLICGSCQKEGHCKADCKEDELPPLRPLPLMKPFFINQLTSIFEKLKSEFEPRKEEIEDRDRIVTDLEYYIRQYFPGVTLKLFGSSANGFGFQRSDLDICLTFEGNQTGQDIDHIKIIEYLAEKLKKYRQCGHVFAITTAKVPIVKFSIRRAQLEGDLSLYNTLALQNTKLLLTYSNIDYRVKCLGYGMKYFAKLCDIGDASRGSLSSYAYILMVLHFLQQCKPPVIPVLQELYDHSKPAPELIIDGTNAWFYEDLESLHKAWKDFGKNKESVGHLWVSMLRYYTETFNWKEHVITIRQHAALTRLEKLWNSRCIVIEDPFDLNHNLGAGLSRKMNTFIMKAFIRGREIFGSPISVSPQGYKHLVDYLFDIKHLTDGAPPNDRGCRFCGKIGHIQRDCPKKKISIERREKKERQKDRHEQHRSAAEGMAEDSPKSGLKPMVDAATKKASEKITNSHSSLKNMEDVASGKPAGPKGHGTAASSKLDHSAAKDVNRPVADQTTTTSAYGKQSSSKLTPSFSTIMPSSKKAVKPLVSSTVESKSIVNSVGNKDETVISRTEPTKNNECKKVLVNGPCSSNAAVSNSKYKTSDSAVEYASISLLSSETHAKDKAKIGGNGQDIIASLNVPPGFHHLGNSSNQQGFPPHSPPETIHKEQLNKQNVNSIGVNNLRNNSNSVSSSNNSLSRNDTQSQNSQHQKQIQEPQAQQKYWENWPSSIPQPQIVSRPEVSVKNNPVPLSRPSSTTTTAQNNPQPQQQQQYYYSISPAVLFQMASQAAGGQLSAVLMPNVSESTGNTQNTSITSNSSPGTQSSSVSAQPPPPPPGFTAPVNISYANQPLHSLPYNKLVMGSPLYRTPVSQNESQAVAPSTASQSYMATLGQSIGGIPNVYALQQNSGGNQFTSMTPSAAAHTPHSLNDPNLSQQVPFDARQFLSQVPQGLHQGVQQQGIPTQNITAIPPGIPQSVTQAVPQGLQSGAALPPPGLSTSLPQGVSQGLHQSITGGVAQASLGATMSPGLQPVPIGHVPPQHFQQPSFPQQGYQMTMTGPSGFYPEFVFGDPSMQSQSTNNQGPPTLPTEMIPDIAFQRPDVYDSPMAGLPQYLASSLPQQNILSQLSQQHPNLNLTAQPGPPPTGAGPPGTTYASTDLIFIEGERDGSQILQ